MLVKLMLLSQNLSEGQAVEIPREWMIKAVKKTLSSMIFETVRDSDIKDFINKVSINWDVEITENEIGNFTMRKIKTEADNELPKLQP